MKDLWSGKYGFGSVMVLIGTALYLVLRYVGVSITVSYALPIAITFFGEWIKFSAFRDVTNELRDKTECLYNSGDHNMFLVEENRRFEEEVKMQYEQINRLEAVIESHEIESAQFEKDEFDLVGAPPEHKPRRVLH